MHHLAESTGDELGFSWMVCAILWTVSATCFVTSIVLQAAKSVLKMLWHCLPSRPAALKEREDPHTCVAKGAGQHDAG